MYILFSNYPLTIVVSTSFLVSFLFCMVLLLSTIIFLLLDPQSSVVVGRWLTHPCGSLPTGEVGAFGCEATYDTFSLGVMVIKVSNRGFDLCE